MSRRRGLALLLVFVAVLWVPFVVQLTTSPTEDAGGENRTLAEAPDPPASLEEVWDLPEELDAYLDDRFGLRRALVQANARARFAIGASADPRVEVGRDGWLFFTGDDLPDQILGRRDLDLERADAFDAYLDQLVEHADAVGARVIVTVAPNKAAIHPEYLPAWLAAGPERTPELERFQQLVRDRGDVELVDLHQPLRDAAAHEQVYRALDTHWNDRGGFIAYRTLWDVVAGPDTGLQEPDVPLVTVEQDGDLVGMLGLEGLLTEPVPTVSDLPDGPIDGPSVVLLGDSFGNRLAPFFEASSSELHAPSHRWGDRPFDVIDEAAPDVVVFEVVERDLRRTWRTPGS